MNETADNIAKHTDEVYLRSAELGQHRGIKHTFREKQLYKAVLIAYKPPASANSRNKPGFCIRSVTN